MKIAIATSNRPHKSKTVCGSNIRDIIQIENAIREKPKNSLTSSIHGPGFGINLPAPAPSKRSGIPIPKLIKKSESPPISSFPV